MLAATTIISWVYKLSALAIAFRAESDFQLLPLRFLLRSLCFPSIVHFTVSPLVRLRWRSDSPVGWRELDVLRQALLDTGNVAQGSQGIGASLFEIPPDGEGEVGDQTIHANVQKVLDRVERVGSPGLDLHTISMRGVDHGLVGERNVSGQ